MVAASRKGSGQVRVSFIRPTDPPQSELPTTFIDEYTNWAKTVTDAPEQYHRVTGTVILSTIMTPYIYLETSYGRIMPNIWAMILAGTTVTRKSTSMDLAMTMLDDVMDDYMLATDGSPEGLLTELSMRDGKVSVFHRDEITGFMAQISGRDYLAGLLESFTRLYDGKREKRILRRESIEIEKPRLVFMAGGIKTKMEELVGMEHIRSGFLPRFLFVTGSTSSDQIRPIGPPPKAQKIMSTVGESHRDQVLNKLYKLAKYYTFEDSQSGASVVAGVVKVSAPKPKSFEIEGTDEAWERIRQLKDDAIKIGEASSAPELYTPLYDRLSNTVIKVAILLAGADYSTTLTLTHVQKAIALSQEWIEAVTDFASAIEQAPEMNPFEKKIDKIVFFVASKFPEPVTERDLMDKFRIRKKDMNDIRQTCIERGAVTVEPQRIQATTPGTKIQWFSNKAPKSNKTPKTRVEREDSFVSHEEEVRQSASTTNGRGASEPPESGHIRIPASPRRN